MKKTLAYSMILPMAMTMFASCGNRKHDEHATHAEQVNTAKEIVQPVELQALLKPANEFVVSTIPVIAIEQRTENVELNVVGIVAHDTRQAGTISSRVKGRIEKLYVRYKYQPVKEGQKIMDIYSPELLTAQQNLIFLLRNDENNTSLINAAKNRLRLMGMTAGQVAALEKTKSPNYAVSMFSNYSGFVTDLNSGADSRRAEGMKKQMAGSDELAIKEGMYIESGQAIFSIYNPQRAWILLDIFPDQQHLVKSGDQVSVVPESSPQQKIKAKINYIEPVFRPGAKTLSARVYINNADLQLPIGSRVTATIFASSTNASWVPREAVIFMGRSKVVFLKQRTGFRAHEVTTGVELNRSIQIVTGLSPQDSVAANAHFLIDNEAFIKVSDQ